MKLNVDKKSLLEFLLLARTKTYAGSSGKVKPAFEKSFQLEYKDKNFFYRDVYNNGNGIFAGLETIYFKDTPIFTMSYFGNYKKVTEKEIDDVLRTALVKNQKTTRIWKNVSYKIGDYNYECQGSGNWDEFGGTEEIFKKGKKIYWFYYAAGLLI